MLTFLGALLRVLIGFSLACLAAGFVQVLFAVTPTELVVAGDDRIGEAITWGLLSATQIAVFAAPFAFIAVLISEWLGLRSFAYHAMVAMAISVAGFGLIHMTESPTEASIVNSYAMAAYLTSGFVAGFVYWLFSGRRAIRRGRSIVRMESDRQFTSPSDAPPPRRETATAAERSVADKSGKPGERQAAGRSTGSVPVTSGTARNGGAGGSPPAAKPTEGA